ncbi:PA1414 family protein [Pseudomonas sp.]|nr:PA1414 family protein [Pseudomonas sp.]MDP3815550.1 PA1414 family protein [Pseudomonas sp.]HLA31296.1 PA1414 family protein [Pseudomonas sp.]
MIAKLHNLLHDLLAALGLLDRPKLQPIPVRHGDQDRPAARPRRR